jgi:hypothetical protein
MLEIILIVVLSKKIAAMASEKGRAAAGYVVLFILGWLGGEFIGAIFGVILNKGDMRPTAYLFALIGAAIGAGSVFTLVALLPSLEEEDYRPRRKRRRRRRDEDDYDGERRSRREVSDGDESYREKFRAKRKREVEDAPEEDDADAGYRRKRRSSEED